MCVVLYVFLCTRESVYPINVVPLLPPSHLPLSSHLSQQKKQKKKKKDDDEDEYTQAPRIYLLFPQDACHKYQLRAYIYQARDMHGSDESGLSGLCVCGGGGLSL